MSNKNNNKKNSQKVVSAPKAPKKQGAKKPSKKRAMSFSQAAKAAAEDWMVKADPKKEIREALVQIKKELVKAEIMLVEAVKAMNNVQEAFDHRAKLLMERKQLMNELNA